MGGLLKYIGREIYYLGLPDWLSLLLFVLVGGLVWRLVRGTWNGFWLLAGLALAASC